MKSSVAFLLVLAVFGSAAVAQRQPQRQNQSAVNKPRADTMRICQGLAVPDGYVIIAYTTSSACPHGAYVLKKQADYESSSTVNGEARPPAESSEPKNTAAESTTSTKQPPRTSIRTTSGSTERAARSSTNSREAPPQVREVSAPPASSASSTRPRRVGAPEPAEGPPTLIGSQPAPALGPPSLANTGTAPAGAIDSELSSANAVPAATPEEVEEGDVVRVDTSLVTVPVSVLDRQGRFVPNLRREDFSVFENGVEQSIAYFEPAEKPFTVALVLDTSASTHFHLWEIKEAAIAFAKQLRPLDRVLVVSFNDEVLLLTEATNDLNTVEAVIEENANPGSSTRLYDAVDLTIKERLNKIKGRKAIVLFTDGVDTSSQQATYQGTLREVEELDALIYPIQYDTSDYLRAMQGAGGGSVTITTRRGGLFGTTTSQQTYSVPANAGLPLPGTTKADYDRADQYLHGLADKTGGRLYQANDTTQLAQAFTQIAEELRRQYSLGYYPKTGDANGNARREIRVRVRQRDLAVKARDSYVKSAAPIPNK
jgi:VWFA-related protein